MLVGDARRRAPRHPDDLDRAAPQLGDLPRIRSALRRGAARPAARATRAGHPAAAAVRRHDRGVSYASAPRTTLPSGISCSTVALSTPTAASAVLPNDA